MNTLNRFFLNYKVINYFNCLSERLFSVACIIALCFILMPDVYAAQKSKINEQLKVKAAFVLNLARFVEWPDEIRVFVKPCRNIIFLTFPSYVEFLFQDSAQVRQ